MSYAAYDSVSALVFLGKKRYNFIKTFCITEILALAIVRTLDTQLSVETQQFALQSEVVILLHVSAGWLGPGSLQILVEFGELEEPRLPEKAIDQKYFLLFLVLFSLHANLYL